MFISGDPNMSKYYLIQPEWKQFNEDGKSQRKWRYQFPIELAFVMTSFKGIGATHNFTEIMLKGNFEHFYVATTRPRKYKANYIPPLHFPNIKDLQVLRLKSSILDAENFERTIKYKHAHKLCVQCALNML